uniref:F-box domain-containing protein n=1 Tax=Rhizophagus irregularis (strain DAOM 181602 / DAOM 197198 / MUCL 43194) TaxID=747089 RepID=U9TAU9_RHIID
MTRGNDNSPLSFINSFSNLQEIAFTFFDENDYEDFSNLQHANFSKLQILKFPSLCPNPEHVMNFLEHNGQTLKYFYTSESDKALRLSVAKFCPNLRRLFVIFKNDELDVLKTILCSCQNLEGHHNDFDDYEENMKIINKYESFEWEPIMFLLYIINVRKKFFLMIDKNQDTQITQDWQNRNAQINQDQQSHGVQINRMNQDQEI